MTSVKIDIKVEISATATSTFTREQVEQRLAGLLALEDRSGQEDEEITYLTALKRKKGWD